MGAVKEVSSAAMPYVILGGVVLAIYLMRNQIKNWFIGSTQTGQFISESGKVLDTSIFKPAGTPQQVDVASKIIPSFTDLASPGGIGLIDNIKASIDVLMGKTILSDGSAGSVIPSSAGSAGYESISGLPGAAGSLTEQNLAVNAALFAQLPTSYEQVKQFDINPGRGFLDFDYVKGDEALQITSDSWHYLQYQKHSWGWEWTDIASSGGSSPAVWHNPSFIQYLGRFV